MIGKKIVQCVLIDIIIGKRINNISGLFVIRGIKFS